MTKGGINVTSSSSSDLKKYGMCGASVKDLYNHNYHKHQEKVSRLLSAEAATATLEPTAQQRAHM